MQSVSGKIVSRIYGHGRGWSFSKIDFLDLATAKTAESALLRLHKKGTIRRIRPGIYDYPRRSELLNTELAPDITQVARALARKHRWRIIPEGPTATYLLGLTEQVPAQYRYLSTGPNRTFQIMEIPLCFIHRKTQHTAIDDNKAALLIQAIYSIGQGKLSNAQLEQLSKVFPPQDYPKIVRSTVSATAWVHDYIKQIAVQASARRQDR